MPRARPRRQPCDCKSCLDDASRAVDPSLLSALARQEPPAKSFVIVVEGALCSSPDGAVSLQLVDCPHLDMVARDGCCGLLAAASTNDAETADPACSNLTSQLLRGSDGAASALPQRFMGMETALLSNAPGAERLAKELSCRIVPAAGAALPFSLADATGTWPAAEHVANGIIKSLRVRPLEEHVASFSADSRCVIDDDEAEMAIALLHTQRGEAAAASELCCNDSALVEACAALTWLDALLRRLDAVPGFRDTVLLTLVLTPGSNNAWSAPTPLLQQQPMLRAGGAESNGGNGEQPVTLRRPLQTYQFRGTEVAAVDAERPGIVIHRLAGTIRRDHVASLDLAAIERCGGGGCILAERVLYEICYKIGRAPKYGA